MKISTLHRAKFAIDLESLLTLPASVFWKDIRGVYLGCNDVMADLVSLPSRQAVVGMDDVDLVGHDAAMIFIDHDREVIRSSTPRVVDEYFRNEQGSLIKGISTKAPLFDQDGILVGLWGISFLEEVSEDVQPNAIQMSSDTRNKYNDILNQTQRLANRSGVTKVPSVEKLSTRERQCLQLVAKGHSAKAIAEELELSKRTVETYIDNVKSKLGCINKTELIVAAIKYKYIDIELL